MEPAFHPWPHKHPLNDLASSGMGQKACISHLLLPLEAVLWKLHQKEATHDLHIPSVTTKLNNQILWAKEG